MACGLAAGLSVAFSAPIAGILFAMEGAVSASSPSTQCCASSAAPCSLCSSRTCRMNGWSCPHQDH